MSGSPPATRPWFAEFVLLAAIWGSSFLFTRLAVVEFGALPTAGVRVAIASLFLLPLLLMRGHGRELRQHWKAVFLVGLLNSGLPFACFAFALLYLTTGLSAILNATVPLFGALVAWAWLKDRPDASRILGLVIGFAGVALLAGCGGNGTEAPYINPPPVVVPPADSETPMAEVTVGCHLWSPPQAARSVPRWVWRCRLFSFGPLVRQV